MSAHKRPNATHAAFASDPSRIESIAPAELPALIGEIEALKARLWARLAAPSAANATAAEPKPATEPDRLLTATEAAEKLGTDRRWIYRHAHQLPTTKLPGGTLRFSSRALDRWLANRRRTNGR